MDSNTSSSYEKTFLAEGENKEYFVSTIIEKLGFKDITDDGNQCFKMRHA